jgi:hypothetical protein
VAEIDRWYVAHFASFFRWLEQTRDTDGRSLPDNARIVYRGGNADANRHTHSNLPLVLAGGGGGTLNPGRYVPHGWKPTSNLFLSLADRMGIAGLERIGDSTGRLTRIWSEMTRPAEKPVPRRIARTRSAPGARSGLGCVRGNRFSPSSTACSPGR